MEESEKGERKALAESIRIATYSLTKKFNLTREIGKLCTAADAEEKKAKLATRDFLANGLRESAVYAAANKAIADAKKAFEDHKLALSTDYRGKSKLFEEAQGWPHQTREKN